MAATKITVRTDGSIRVEGDFEMVDQDGKAFGLAGRDKIGLCRCGHSANKPFCDGAHKNAELPEHHPGVRSSPGPSGPAIPKPSARLLGKNLSGQVTFPRQPETACVSFCDVVRTCRANSMENSIVR